MNAVLVDERDIGRMIVNAQCLHPVRPRKTQSRTARIMRRQHLSNQVKQVGMCFVLNDYSDDPRYIRVHGRSKRTSSEGVSQADFDF